MTPHILQSTYTWERSTLALQLDGKTQVYVPSFIPIDSSRASCSPTSIYSNDIIPMAGGPWDHVITVYNEGQYACAYLGMHERCLPIGARIAATAMLLQHSSCILLFAKERFTLGVPKATK